MDHAAMGAHGTFTTEELRASGHTIDSIRAAIGAGRLERIIRGWYCVPGTDRDIVRAIRVGGRLTCVSALALLGAWTAPTPAEALHIGFPSHASGRRASVRGLPEAAVAHWHPKAAHTGSAFAVMPLEAAVDDLLRCQPPHLAIAVLDSLLHERLVNRNRLEAMILAGPHRTRFLVEHLEPRSESGIESVVRFRLAMAGIHAEVQVRTRTAHRLDLEIGDWLAIEVDGRAVHAQRAAFTKDRVRSAQVMRDGRIVLQFAFATVMYDWDFVQGTIVDVDQRFGPVHR